MGFRIFCRIWFLCFSAMLWAQEIYFEDDFESGVLNPNFWDASPSGATIRIGEAAQGQYSAYLGGAGTNYLDLTVDLSGTNQAELEFNYRDYGSSGHPLTGLWLSPDGGNHFVKVFSFLPERWSTCWGAWPRFDLDQLAAQAGLRFNSQFMIRFQHEGSGSNGMGLDAVRISRPLPPTYAHLPVYENFETELGNMWRRNFPSPGQDDETSPCGIAQRTSRGISDAYSLLLGKVVSGAESTQALDLHLDLAGHDRVVLQFMIGVLEESQHSEDGIFLSDDGGDHFVKAFSFKTYMWDTPNYGGKLPPLELGTLARNLGLNLTDRFVVRFQQRDDGTSVGNGASDGIWLDEITVTGPPISYARPPFQDSFEEGVFGSMWAWRAPEPTSFNMRNSGTVRVQDSYFGFPIARTGNYGAMLTKIGESGTLITANALDLHLNLADLENLMLRFYFKDFGWEEAEPEDGIYLQTEPSGAFVKIWALRAGDLAGNEFRELVLPLSQLAQEKGLRLGERCVVRFQQIGRYSPANFFEHGWMLDDVSVSGTPSSNFREPIAVVPWIVDNQAFQSQIALFNDGQEPAEIELIGVDETGQSRQASRQLAPKSMLSLAAATLFPGMSRYALTISANRATIYTTMLTFNIEPLSGGSSPSQTTASPKKDWSPYLLFGYLPSDQFSAVVLVAPEIAVGSTSVILELFASDGQKVAEKRITLNANAPFAALLQDLFANLPLEAALVARTESGTLLAGTTFIFNHLRQPSMDRPFSR